MEKSRRNFREYITAAHRKFMLRVFGTADIDEITMAPPMHTFLKSQDWTGKTVIPFMTHGGWPGHVITDIKEYCAGEEFAADMEIQFDSEGGDHMLTSQADIDAWLEVLRKELR